MTMTFKEALIARLRGENVESKYKNNDWMRLDDDFGHIKINSAIEDDHDSGYTFRLAPRTILVNGVEVPWPEKDAPEVGATYYVPDQSEESLAYDFSWGDDDMDARFLDRGLVYLRKEDAIARAKAMLITQEVK